MAILQISKIQQRTGNLVDLPQLDDAEFGWANDARRLFIGKSTPNENIEVLTSYSTISFSQVDGAVGNLNISAVNIADGQVLTYDGTNWVNRGGSAGGLITLGDVGNVKLNGGATGYVLQTDGLGNLSWTPKGTLVAGILNVTKATTAVVTTLGENFFTNGAQVTMVDPQGMDQLSGNIYYANVLTSTTFGLYTAFDGTTFSGNVNSTSYNAYSYTTVSATTVSTNVITVANSSPFTIGSAVQFVGNMSTSNISNTAIYYVQAKPNTTSLKIATSSDANASNVVSLQTTTGLTAQVYQTGGQAISTLGSSVTFSPAGGADTQIQYNESGSLQGSGLFTYNYGSSILTLVGNANVSNLNATGVVTSTRLVSNIITGTAPLVVTSTTQVANLNVATSGSVVNGNSNVNIPAANGNVTISAIGNANIVVVTGTGVNVAGTFNASGNANVGNLGTAGLVVATGNVTGGNLTTGGVVAATGNVSGGNITTAGVVAATGNVSGGNLTTAGALSVTGNANVGNLGTATAIITTGNITTINSGLLQNGTSNVVVTASGGNVTLGVAGTTRITATSSGANVTGTLDVSGNITAANFVGILANGNSDVNIPAANGNINFDVAGNANILVVTGTGANIAGTLNATGNANVGNLGTGGLIVATGNVTGGNLVTAGLVSATGNVTGGNLITAGALSVTGNATTGNLSTTTAVITTGNITTINSGLLQNGNSNITLTSNANVTVFVAGNTTARWTATSTGVVANGTYSISGNANVGNLGTAGLITATGNVSGGNLTTAGVVAATGNVSGGNITTAGQLVSSVATGTAPLSVTSTTLVTNLNADLLDGLNSASANTASTIAARDSSGNLSANFFIGNGSQLTGITASQVSGIANGNSNVSIPAANGNVNISAVGNANILVVTGTGVNVAGTLNASGNVNGANVVVTSYHIRSINGAVSAAGTAQGDATALTKEINVVSTVATGAGVVLPTAVAGMVLIINNTSANTLNVYPASGGAVNSGSANAAYSHTSGASIQYYATSGTQWYTVGATFA
jgi:filamentous hemagglutinin